ncbi:hypothetical protein COCHEDRAFT_1018755 [Bipolaris maydis C5]|uniref:Uncharacterized protein n=1 Tax=Cochliobolus heterostrophus (strain C5 / ATCC 48332 / race O) TaxID=701091 RepID=M2UF48_COCH5|nr:hypothetical protein COCHEDRAFT_1018755 [Bipolaris maydis C5]
MCCWWASPKEPPEAPVRHSFSATPAKALTKQLQVYWILQHFLHNFFNIGKGGRTTRHCSSSRTYSANSIHIDSARHHVCES